VRALDQIDWNALNGVSRPKIAELTTCGFIDKAEDMIIAGPVGTGKTHLAIALGVEATRRRHRVAFFRAADLVRELFEARDTRTLGRLHRRVQRASLLFIDELGFVPFDRTGGELLFNLLSGRHERRSTLVTTNNAQSQRQRPCSARESRSGSSCSQGHPAQGAGTPSTLPPTRQGRTAAVAPPGMSLPASGRSNRLISLNEGRQCRQVGVGLGRGGRSAIVVLLAAPWFRSGPRRKT